MYLCLLLDFPSGLSLHEVDPPAPCVHASCIRSV